MTDLAPQLILLAPDEMTTQYVARTLAASGLSSASTFTPSKSMLQDTTRAIDKAKQPVLLIVSSTKLRRAQLDLADHTVSMGGTVVVWSAGSHETDPWILDKLLQQRGALPSTRLTVAVETVRLAIFLGKSKLQTIRMSGRFGELTARFKSILKDHGVSFTTSTKSDLCALSCLKDGLVQLTKPGGESTRLNDLESFVSAISLLASSSALKEMPCKITADDVNTETVQLIARPPARLLSESTSKKLAAAYGISSGPERLCQSPTEASRFAGELDAPVVLKLVRPSLEAKEDKGAVIGSVQNGAAVRQGFHKLKSMADILGPPKPLGILVAQEIPGGSRIWTKMVEHKIFGQLIFLGVGDRPTSNPDFALTVPVSLSQAQNALEKLLKKRPQEEISSLAEGLFRLSILLDTLGKRISRAEIHPLVALGNTPAMALDALFSIDD